METAAEEEDRVKGGKEIMKAAEAGLKLFATDTTVKTIDKDGATAFKADHEAAIKTKEDEAAALTGKDNKKAKTEKSKEAAAMKNEPKYIDACKVLKGLDPPNGNFMTEAEDPAVTAKKAEDEKAAKEAAAKEEAEAAKKAAKEGDKKPAKKTESAGISKAERDELEKIKTDLIARKGDLKAQGMSGGQCNKDEQVVEWVKRMTELKLKEDPTSGGDGKEKKADKKAEKGKSTEEKIALQAKIEEYKQELIAKFKYTGKEIKADPDMVDMVNALAKMK